MPELPFPSSGGVFEAFLERIRFSPRVKVDTNWLVHSLGISQRTNAGRTLKWLKVIGVLSEDGSLTELGLELLKVPRTAQYKGAAAKALLNAVGQEHLGQIKSGDLDRVGLRRILCNDFGVKHNTANKAIVGMYVLAEAADDRAVANSLGREGYESHQVAVPRKKLKEVKAAILDKFQLFTGDTGGIDGWLGENTPEVTFERFARVPVEPLTVAQFNQLLTLTHAPPLSEGFFRYYWLSCPRHPYDLEGLPFYRTEWQDSLAIFDLDQLYWGLYRFYIDALLYFGNIRSAYQHLRVLNLGQLEGFFRRRMFDPNRLIARGSALDLHTIAEDDRYLISEMACKSYEPSEGGVSLEQALKEAYAEHRKKSPVPVTPGELLDSETGSVTSRYPDLQGAFYFAAVELLDKPITSERDLERMLQPIKKRFDSAREAALLNTELYLASVGEMDAYVATSMRSRNDFYNMAGFCQRVFGDRQLRKYRLRYFDPTLSAAANHQDKGLIECLMVKCARILIYTSGDKESFGKDAEAAMALSLGKPVIFFCDTKKRQQFYKDVHPLSRLVDFQTGVAVGALVTDKERDVIELVDRILTNSMSFRLEQRHRGYYVLKETITDCVVRLQTSDKLLRETFWNHYHGNGQPITLEK